MACCVKAWQCESDFLIPSMCVLSCHFLLFNVLQIYSCLILKMFWKLIIHCWLFSILTGTIVIYMWWDANTCTHVCGYVVRSGVCTWSYKVMQCAHMHTLYAYLHTLHDTSPTRDSPYACTYTHKLTHTHPETFLTIINIDLYINME